MTPLDIATDFCAAVRLTLPMKADFPAFRIRPFPQGLVKEMVEDLPPLAACRPMPHPDAMVDGATTRFGFPLNADISPFWADIAEALKSDRVRLCVAGALGLPPAAMHPAVALIRDLPGYKIGIHPDSARKLATVQVYLAANDRAPHMGVRFYRQARLAKVPTSFIETAAVPYLPGSGYMFRRTPASWHGVNPVTEQDGERNSLVLIYFNSTKVSFS